MARLSLLLPLIFALSFDPAYARVTHGGGGVGVFLGVLLALVVLGRVMALRLSDRVADEALHEAVGRLTRVLGFARMAALLWTGAGLYFFGWAGVVPRVLASVHLSSADLASALLLTLPSYAAWIGLYWAQYPADRATREQAIVMQLDANIPVRSPPSVWQFLEHHLRTGPGLILLPVLVVLLTRDVMFLSLRFAQINPPAWVQAGLYFASTVMVYVLSPLILIRVLRTTRLPDGQLRSRLEALAKRSGVKVRGILVWHTGNSAGNALVSGVLAPFRFVLLSDLLLESMPDEHIEAVFAHELGHIVHKHMAWYGAFLLSLTTVLGWLVPAQQWLEARLGVGLGGEALNAFVSLALVLYAFGMLSRRFERQADVFAARAIQPPRDATGAVAAESQPAGEPASGSTGVYSVLPPLKSVVGPRGAMLFGEALSRVAWINNLPVSAPNFSHGSIQSRIDSLAGLAANPESTPAFDGHMRRVRWALVALMLAAALTVFAIGLH